MSRSPTPPQFTPENYEQMLKLVESGDTESLIALGRLERSRAVHRFIKRAVARFRRAHVALPHGAAHA